MKSLKNAALKMKIFYLLLLFTLAQTAVWAQDATPSVNVNIKDGNNWYSQPWVWIVGGAVFLLLLVALLRGNSNKN